MKSCVPWLGKIVSPPDSALVPGPGDRRLDPRKYLGIRSHKIAQPWSLALDCTNYGFGHLVGMHPVPVQASDRMQCSGFRIFVAGNRCLRQIVLFLTNG